jgi:16S rRNA C1402 N4-methylase RsmH
MCRTRWTSKEDRIVKSVIKKNVKTTVAIELLENMLPCRTYSAIGQRVYKFKGRKNTPVAKIKVLSRVEKHSDHVRIYF